MPVVVRPIRRRRPVVVAPIPPRRPLLRPFRRWRWGCFPIVLAGVLIFLSGLFYVNKIYAGKEYTQEEISQHNIEDDCWVIFENKVYDITNYLPEHDIYLDIRTWCGTDRTQDFKDKAGLGEDHRSSSYRLLESYYIGDLAEADREFVSDADNSANNEENEYSVEISGHDLMDLSVKEVADSWGIDANELLEQLVDTYNLDKDSYTIDSIIFDMKQAGDFSPSDVKAIAEEIKQNGRSKNIQSEHGTDSNNSNSERSVVYVNKKYMLVPILIISLVLYFASYFIATKLKWISIMHFNAFWNSVLILLFIVPGVMFGLSIVLRRNISWLHDIDFDFKYWHAQLSSALAGIGMGHIVTRWKVYFMQLKQSFKRKK